MAGMTRPISTVTVNNITVALGSATVAFHMGSVAGGGATPSSLSLVNSGTVSGYLLMLARNGVVQAPTTHYTNTGNKVTLLEASNATDLFTYCFLAV